ncbi:glycosyltransferase family 1 protein [Pedobacter sp. MC2016-24]|uniref:glycosyltransferase family 4 protein n=1 Tax=Pedobacter sp. MC2016-24 TaxID=2780090 RepID=UPI001881221D|nr:glycosyltransferase family 1 protein [Pedobacter sp. MC2016-24]MBE9603018.1 glycosyltransferase family 4 protein [Pedobacter sp. MC2016-24]
MNIGFDGKRAANNLTGLGNYSRSLIAHLAKYFPQNQYLVYTPKLKDNPQITSFKKASDNIRFILPAKAGLLWRSLGIKKQLLTDKIDLFHGLSHEIPIGMRNTGIPTLVTIHDLIFLKFPQYFGRIDRLIYHLKIRYACKHADKIIAISEQTRQDIIAAYQVDPGKIEVVYQSCDDAFKVLADENLKEQVRKKYKLPLKYILNVGTIESRKNLLTLVQALKDVDPEYKLVVVGKKTSYAKLVITAIERLGLGDRIVFLKNIPFHDLPVIYQMASVFCYPSLYEGFGIPIIEALYSNVPVVAATGSCLEEAGGPQSLYVAPMDHEHLASCINKILTDADLQNKMRKYGLEYVQKFDNKLVTSQMMDIYKNTCSATHFIHQ